MTVRKVKYSDMTAERRNIVPYMAYFRANFSTTIIIIAIIVISFCTARRLEKYKDGVGFIVSI
jgi:hypothetical protein